MLIVSSSPRTPPTALAKIGTEVDYNVPAAGRAWKGVKHSDLLKCLQKNIELLSVRTGTPHVWTTCNGGDAHACFEVGVGQHWVGVSATNLRHGRLRLYPSLVMDGVRLVYDCLIGARYTLVFDLEQECRILAMGWKTATEKVGALVDSLKKCHLTTADAGLVILNAARMKCLIYRKIPAVESLFRDGKDMTAWGLIRAYCLGTSIPVSDQLSDLHKFYQIVSRKLTREVA